jgi:hypothetical protein
MKEQSLADFFFLGSHPQSNPHVDIESAPDSIPSNSSPSRQ